VIPIFEKVAGSHSMFLRPPRFGKSLLKSTIHSYYDSLQEKEFDRLFGDLYIGKNPTPLRNSFYVLSLDFSVDVDGRDPALISASLRRKINSSVERFSHIYGLHLKIFEEDAFASLQSLMNEVSRSSNPRLFVLIDEYDRFANKLMLENLDAYRGVVAGVSGERLSSPIRAFYETLKEGVPGLKDYRSISFGVAPIALTSGANHIDLLPSWNEQLTDACGFTQQDRLSD